MQIALPSGTTWHVREAAKKLAHRGQLPGARVFDLAGASLRAAKASGVSASDRFTLALPASWLVNSPAISRVLRRWALEPHRETCLAMIELLEAGPAEWSRDPGTREAISLGVASLGDEPYVTEALSKVLALLVPEAVPLMPPAARAFVLGEGDATKDSPDAFALVVDWFARAVLANEAELAEIARAHVEVEITGAGVLDRLLWFDSEGHRHFPKIE
ncbi:MAG: hypothetical protein ACLQVI_38860 [Polyangiaceae bacterium]|jgi:hypothetical protein